MLKLGDTFLMPETSSGIEHLYIVITEPDEKGNAVCVNVTTPKAFSETACVLKKGDHPFITHESVVLYSDAKVLDLNLVEKALQMKQTSFVCKRQDACTPETLKVIQDGMLQSKRAPKGIKERCQKCWQGNSPAKQD